MYVTYNDATASYNLVCNIKIDNGDDSLSKDLKVKIVKDRIALKRAATEYDACMKEAMDSLATPEMKELNGKQDRTEEETKHLQDMISSANEAMLKLSEDKLVEIIDIDYDKFTEDEFEEIMRVNIDNDVVINDNKISADKFLEFIHDLMVEQ